MYLSISMLEIKVILMTSSHFAGPDSFTHANEKLPEFPLVPASKGFCLSLDKSIEAFKTALKAKNIAYCD